MRGLLLLGIFCISAVAAETDPCLSVDKIYEETLQMLQKVMRNNTNVICSNYDDFGYFKGESCQSALAPKMERLLEGAVNTIISLREHICPDYTRPEAKPNCDTAESKMQVLMAELKEETGKIVKEIEESVCTRTAIAVDCNELMALIGSQPVKFADDVNEKMFDFLCMETEPFSKKYLESEYFDREGTIATIGGRIISCQRAFKAYHYLMEPYRKSLTESTGKLCANHKHMSMWLGKEPFCSLVTPEMAKFEGVIVSAYDSLYQSACPGETTMPNCSSAKSARKESLLMLEEGSAIILKEIEMSVCSFFADPEGCNALLNLLINEDVKLIKKTIDHVCHMMCADPKSILKHVNKEEL